jgi:antitoxin component YwqK of YwqJK toxin-antitoxin module
MIQNFILYSIIFITSIINGPEAENKIYAKEYYESGILKAEGWVQDGVKEDYWIYYYSNKTVSQKGHYLRGKSNQYWFFYSKDGSLLKEGMFNKGLENGWWILYQGRRVEKVKFNNGMKEGFALIYENNKLKKAEKYLHNIKTGEWTSLLKFKNDNPEVQF